MHAPSWTRRWGSAAAVCAAALGWQAGCGSVGLNLGDTPSDGGSLNDDGGAAGEGGSSGSGGGCPIYQALCNGKCIPVSGDPKNCGGCGVVCAANQVCSAGACSGSCLPGLTACNGTCSDTENDNANCGKCGNACPAKTGCVAGQCVPSLGGSGSCVGNGPPVGLGGTPAGCVAQTTFTWALCSCRDVSSSGAILTDGYDSTRGPYAPGGLGGGIGIDEALHASNALNVWGAFWASSPNGIATSGQVDVKQETHIGGGISTSSTMVLEDDAYANGDLSSATSLSVKKALHVPATARLSGNVTYGSIVRAPVNVPPACACGPNDLLPIASWIAAARPPNNDNATIQLDPNVLAAGRQQPTRIDLPCGRYYLTGINSSTPVTIAAHGNTALFIDGDVSTSSSLAFVLDPTAQFDVVVAGHISTSASLVVGSPNYPALSRTYFGGASGLSFSSSWRIGGNVYAAYGPVSFASGYTMYGALFAGDFSASGDSAIHYDRAVVGGGLCTPPGGAPDGGGTGGGGTCGTCKDCANQACVSGKCGSCTSSDQCCPPFTCQNGTCGVIPR